MHTQTLNRQQYIDSTMQMSHLATLEFAKQALDWWDDYYSWERDPCLVLYEGEEAICYLFYHISKNSDYLTIHNIFTPHNHRFHGYASKILQILFDDKVSYHTIERVKLYSVSSSIEFYLKLGLDFWGVNEIGQYYSDFPMPKNLADIPNQMQHPHLERLLPKRLDNIYAKLQKNGGDFKGKELVIFNDAKELMQERYRFDEFKIASGH
ncbi:MAG: GNAT family N-acetyltransferase [Campylobacterota bacterium]|nr:GNAT family N-acetyltransferase [Campylobacterota bacterium]